jgi:transcription elongation factor Elf1
MWSDVMPQPSPCPRCSTTRLAVVYFDADGQQIGGHLHCPECGARHAAQLAAEGKRGRVRAELLERKAS